MLTRAYKDTYEELSFKNARIQFSFKTNDLDYPEVGHKQLPQKAYWNLFSPQVKHLFNEELAKNDYTPDWSSDEPLN